VFVLLIILKSVLVPFLIACILAALTWPWRNALLKWTGGRASLASGILVLSMILLVAVPIGAILTLAFFQVQDLLEGFTPEGLLAWVQKMESTAGEWPFLHKLGIHPQVPAEKVQENLDEAVRWGLGQGLSLGNTLLNALVLSGIALMSLFYLYLSGDQIVGKLKNRLPLPPTEVQELLEAFRRTSRAIFKGNFVIGALQGTATGVLFWVSDLPSPAFFGVLAAFCSLIPAVGTGLVWGPAGLLLLLTGETGRAILVLGVGVAVIAMMDSVLRPILVGRDAGMHDLMVFLTTIGGLSFFGPVGILFGPLVGAGVTALLRLRDADVPAESGSISL
jgi:predicted PurR-regulated permease PerM